MARPELVAEPQNRLRDLLRRASKHQAQEQRRGVWLGLRDARETPHERAGDPRIFRHELALEHTDGEALGVVGADRAIGRDRRGAAAPFGRREVGRERPFELAARLGQPRRDEPSRDGDVAPHERLAIGEQAREGRLDRVAAKHTERVGIPLRGAFRGFARGALEEARGEPSRREGTGRGRDDPLAGELAARDERERERAVGEALHERELRDEGDAGQGAARGQAFAARDRHHGGHPEERLGVARVEPREHTTAEITLLAACRKRRGEQVERAAGGGRREPIEIVEEPVGEGGAHTGADGFGAEALEESGPVVDGRARERGHRLAKKHPAFVARALREVDQTLNVEPWIFHGGSQKASHGFRADRTSLQRRSGRGR